MKNLNRNLKKYCKLSKIKQKKKLNMYFLNRDKKKEKHCLTT